MRIKSSLSEKYCLKEYISEEQKGCGTTQKNKVFH